MNHSCDYHEPIDVTQRKKLQSPDAIQLILTLFTFLGSLIIRLKYLNCSWEWSIWINIMLYGSLIWLAFLLLSIVVKYRNKGLQRFIQYLDLLFFAFHIAMWVWLVIIYSDDEWHNKCSDPVDHFGLVYLILGAIALFMLAIAIFGFICGFLTPR